MRQITLESYRVPIGTGLFNRDPYKGLLVGGFNPFEKYARQSGSFRQVGMNINYFTSSDPHHDMLGGGCQVRVVIWPPEVKQSGSEFKTVWDANLLKNYALFQHQDLRLV